MDTYPGMNIKLVVEEPHNWTDICIFTDGNYELIAWFVSVERLGNTSRY